MKKLNFPGVCFFCLTAITTTAQDISWYKCLAGSIDKYPVTMHLHKTGHSLFGYYYYNTIQAPVYFTGEDTTVQNKIKLFVFSSAGGDDDEFFLFTAGPGLFSGQWKKGENGKPLSFSASELKDAALIPFDMVYATGSEKLRPALAGSPVANFDAASVWPRGDAAAMQYLKNRIRASFGATESKTDIGPIFLSKRDEFFSGYKAGFKDEKDDELIESSYAFNADETNRLMVVYQSKKILTLAHFSYLYSGGAHGNYSTEYSSIDVNGKKQIGLNEILNATGKKMLAKLLEKYFRKNYNLALNKPLTDGGLFENIIEPNDNYYITGKGLGFSYGPYEIGPYAMGEINIFIPFTELQAYLQPEFRVLHG